MLAVFEVLVGGGDFGEGKDLVHDAAQLPCLDQLQDTEEVAARAHGGTQDGLLADVKEAEVHLHFRAGRRAAEDQPSALGQAAEARLPGGGTDVVYM